MKISVKDTPEVASSVSDIAEEANLTKKLWSRLESYPYRRVHENRFARHQTYVGRHEVCLSIDSDFSDELAMCRDASC